MPFPYIFTFYSYKGGVGRSMALMNVAYTLAGWGRHVLMVDMDLEAPGISGFLSRSQELTAPEGAHPKDILTLLGEALSGTDSLPAVSNYVRAVADSKLEKLKPRLGKLGRLDVLGTDLDRDYMGRLAQLGLHYLAQDELIGLSRKLHFYFKAQRFPFRPLGVDGSEPAIDTPYDYVLVDSRIGITEIGGLCVGPLADRLVVVTGLNDQNIAGTLAFLKEAGIQPKPRSKDEQPWDDADRVENPSLGPKPTIIVASPVPAGENELRIQRLSELETRLEIRPIPLSYHPRMALRESVFVRDYPQEYLADEYKKLTVRVMEQVGDDTVALEARVRKLATVNRDPMGAVARIASQDPETGGVVLKGIVWKFPAGDSLAVRQALALILPNAETPETGFTDGVFILIQHFMRRHSKLPELAAWLEEARLKSLEIGQTHPGGGRYNLSCLAAWEGDAEEALYWLRAAAAAGQTVSRAQIAAEKDFDRIRDDPAFAAYVQSLPEN